MCWIASRTVILFNSLSLISFDDTAEMQFESMEDALLAIVELERVWMLEAFVVELQIPVEVVDASSTVRGCFFFFVVDLLFAFLTAANTVAATAAAARAS